MTTENMMEFGSGIQGQLSTVLSIYQVLTNLYFLLVEQRASTSASTTRSVISSQVTQLGQLIRGGMNQLSASHRHRLRQLAVFSVPESQQLHSSTPVVPNNSQVVEGIQVLDQILAELVTRARRHARNQIKIEELVSTVQSNDETLKATIKRLSVLREQCRRLVELGREEVKVMERAEQHPIPYDEILKYAKKLSQTTTAPPSFKLQVEEEDGVEEAAPQESGQSSKALYQGAGDQNQGKAGQVPPHLQDKLPFPSIHTMRRSAMETPLLTWDAFKRGFHVGNEDEQQLQDMASEGHSMRQIPSNAVRPKAPADEDEDGFGLDLS